MKSFSVSRTIHASPATIWSLLTDAPGYPTWNSTVERVEGRIAPGEKITVYAKISPGRAFPLTVAEYEKDQRMVWSGGMPLGLFTGARSFSLQPAAVGDVIFEMREEYRGLMAPLITKSIPDLQPAFEQFADDLKRRAEQG